VVLAHTNSLGPLFHSLIHFADVGFEFGDSAAC
jgi:hypothetical protein